MTDVTIRKLEEKDLFRGFLTSLDSLKKASDLNENKAKDVFNKIKSNPNHLVFVVILDDKVAGSTTLLIEPKFIHQGGNVGHIEDVVIAKEFQGSGIGEKLINFVLEYAKKNDCYKTILDCSDDVKPFYEKIGFKKHSNCMRFDHN
ncbi:MAG: GNAT family N-acetyltransferase [Nitrosopumilaceae archaeon]|jgi:glucosamine-phosphate N-acetyltransferase